MNRQYVKGQVATEFMVYIAVFMLLAIGAYAIINQVQLTEIPVKQNSVAKATGDGFANVISLAVQGGNGFTYRYYFPRTILGTSYVVKLNPLLTPGTGTKYVVLEWPGPYGNFSYAYTVPSYNYAIDESTRGVDGNLCLTNQELNSERCGSLIELRNVEGIVTITQVAAG